MKKRLFFTSVFAVTALTCTVPFASCTEKGGQTITPPDNTDAQVTIGTRLEEMVDRDAVARYPQP